MVENLLIDYIDFDSAEPDAFRGVDNKSGADLKLYFYYVKTHFHSLDDSLPW